MASKSDYQTSSEELALNILHKCSIECKRNNIQDVTAVDIVMGNNKTIDVQYSNHYAEYGDFRLDIVSVYKPKEAKPNPSYNYDPSKKLICNFKEKYNCNIIKYGKIFQKGYLDYFIVLFYKQKYTDQNPDFVLLISKEDLVAYCKPRAANLFHQIKTNNKQVGFNDIGLTDEHGSAFVPLNVADLNRSTSCIFGSYEEFLTKKRTNKTIFRLLVFQKLNQNNYYLIHNLNIGGLIV